MSDNYALPKLSRQGEGTYTAVGGRFIVAKSLRRQWTRGGDYTHKVSWTVTEKTTGFNRGEFDTLAEAKACIAGVVSAEHTIDAVRSDVVATALVHDMSLHARNLHLAWLRLHSLYQAHGVSYFGIHMTHPHIEEKRLSPAVLQEIQWSKRDVERLAEAQMWESIRLGNRLHEMESIPDQSEAV